MTIAEVRAARLAEERRAEAEVLRRLSATGRALDGVVRALDWPTGGVGVGAVLRRLAGDGRAHERDGLWYVGPHPSPAISPPVVILPRPVERAPGLTLGPATLPRRSAPLPRPSSAATVELDLLVEDVPLTLAGDEPSRVDLAGDARDDAPRPGGDHPDDDLPVEPSVVEDGGIAAEAPVMPVPATISAPLVAEPTTSSSAWPVDQVLAVLRDHPWPSPQSPTTREIAVQLRVHTALVSAVLQELRRAGAVCSTGRTSGVRWSLWSESTPEADILLDVRTCRVCGCTDDDCTECVKAQGYPCAWVADDLCSRCVVELAVRRLEDLALEHERAAARQREVVSTSARPRSSR